MKTALLSIVLFLCASFSSAQPPSPFQYNRAQRSTSGITTYYGYNGAIVGRSQNLGSGTYWRNSAGSTIGRSWTSTPTNNSYYFNMQSTQRRIGR